MAHSSFHLSQSARCKLSPIIRHNKSLCRVSKRRCNKRIQVNNNDASAMKNLCSSPVSTTSDVIKIHIIAESIVMSAQCRNWLKINLQTTWSLITRDIFCVVTTITDFHYLMYEFISRKMALKIASHTQMWNIFVSFKFL